MKTNIFLFIILSSTAMLSQFKVKGYFKGEINLTYKLSENLQAKQRVQDNLGIEFNSALWLLKKILYIEEYNLNTGAEVSNLPFHFSNIDFFESYFLPIPLEIISFNKIKSFGFLLESTFRFSDIVMHPGLETQ